MKVIKQSVRPRPKVSLLLIDWSVRESFHLLHYLRKQDVDRDLFEVIIIEYQMPFDLSKTRSIRGFCWKCRRIAVTTST